MNLPAYTDQWNEQDWRACASFARCKQANDMALTPIEQHALDRGVSPYAPPVRADGRPFSFWWATNREAS